MVCKMSRVYQKSESKMTVYRKSWLKMTVSFQFRYQYVGHQKIELLYNRNKLFVHMCTCATAQVYSKTKTNTYSWHSLGNQWLFGKSSEHYCVYHGYYKEQ